MKTDNAAFKLMDMGFKAETLASLTESQLVKLYNKLNEGKKETKEQVTPAPVTNPPLKIGPKGGTIPENPKGKGYNITSTKPGEFLATPMESEMKEGKSKKSKKYNPWAICTSTVGRENKKKYERCVMGVKKSVKEGRDPSELFLENKIVSLLERNVQPKISKKEFLDMIRESETTVKPKVPTVKPGETTKRPSTPYNPKPGVKTAPKAKSKAKVETKEQSSPTIAPPKEREKTKTPSTPYKPKPGVKTAPKAGKKSVPSWLSWDKLGINI